MIPYVEVQDQDPVAQFICLMSSLLFDNVDNSKTNKENTWMSRCVQNFDWYCILPTIIKIWSFEHVQYSHDLICEMCIKKQ
jgi:hypothetical protein